MLGGGNFQFYNKILPGSYINFVSLTRASVDMSERGYVAMAYPLGWGEENKIMVIDKASFEKNSLELLGYPYDHYMLFPFREIFKNAKEIIFMNLLKGGTAATNKYATAKYKGSRGNNISIKIVTNTTESSKFDVMTLVDGIVVDTKEKVTKTELQGYENKFVTFKRTIDQELQVTTGEYLGGGTDGDRIGVTEHQTFLNSIESEYFNILICTSQDSSIKKLYSQYTKRMRNEVGAKFQTVIETESANFEGVVNLDNYAISENLSMSLNLGVDTNSVAQTAALIYWVGGALAGCAVNASITNKLYDGELLEKDITLNNNQKTLESKLKSGALVLHRVGKQIKVLSDINSFVEYTPEKNKNFSKNQVIRLLDQVAVDIANLFNKKYLGEFPNDEAGRVDLWKDISLHHENLQQIRAIENFKDTDIKVMKGQEKDELIVTDSITPVVVMEKLYMQVVVK